MTNISRRRSMPTPTTDTQPEKKKETFEWRATGSSMGTNTIDSNLVTCRTCSYFGRGCYCSRYDGWI